METVARLITNVTKKSHEAHSAQDALREHQPLVARWVRETRKSLGINSASALARMLGYSVSYVSGIERGDIPAGEPFLRKLVELAEREVDNV